MARKKKEASSSGGNAPWLATFADLMNLLLCFFVLLFSMSTVDAQKFEQISISLSNTFGIFDGGGSAIGEGQLISAGMTQLNNLDEYFSNMGEDNRNSDEDQDGNPSTEENPGETSTNSESSTYETDLDAAMNKVQKEMTEVSEEMFDEVSDLTEQHRLGDYVELSIDPEHQYVQLSLKGSILFDSGKAEIMEEAKPILSKLGDVLYHFNEYTVEVIGHTDNVPMNSGTYKDNNWLSTARALNSAEFLIENKKLDPVKVKYSGRGQYEPISSNETPDGRAKNRRIEIRIYNELSRR